MVQTRSKRSAPASASPKLVAAKKAKLSKATKEQPVTPRSPVEKKLPFKAEDLGHKKQTLKKVAAPKDKPVVRVPPAKKLEQAKKSLKVATTVVKTSVVVTAGGSPKKETTASRRGSLKAMSSPSKSPVRRSTSPEKKRPSSAELSK